MKETPLQALERLRNKNCEYLSLSMNREVCEDFKIIETALKALEIIKNKNPDICLLKTARDFQHYMNHCAMRNEISEEEYDLLKEVFNENC